MSQKFILSPSKLEPHVSSSSLCGNKISQFQLFFCNIEGNLKKHKLISIEVSVGFCDITLPRFQMYSPGTVNNGWARSQIQEKLLNNFLLASLCYIPHRYIANGCDFWHLFLWWNSSYHIEKKTHTRNLLSDGNDRTLGFLLKAGNWKDSVDETWQDSKVQAHCAIWAGSISRHHREK